MDRTACTEPQCLYSRAIPLLSLWAVRPVQSLSACTVEIYLYSPYGAYGLYKASVPVQVCTYFDTHNLGAHTSHYISLIIHWKNTDNFTVKQCYNFVTQTWPCVQNMNAGQLTSYTKMTIALKRIKDMFIEGSTCFERHNAHHQEL
jgi:hypothetical protein